MNSCTKAGKTLAVKSSIRVGLVGAFVALLLLAVACDGSAAPEPTRTIEQKNRIRAELGLPPLLPDGSEPPAQAPTLPPWLAAPTPTPNNPLITPCVQEFKKYYSVVDTGNPRDDLDLARLGRMTIGDLIGICNEVTLFSQQAQTIALLWRLEVLKREVDYLSSQATP